MRKPKNLPETAGCYIFKDESGDAIYVGKAKNLKNRINSYFSNNLLPKTEQMVSAATSLSTIQVESEFEALLLEAQLVKKYNPKYNIELKDDKSPLYIGITKDRYPRIITFRKPELKDLKLKAYFGPFLSGLTARRVLGRARRVFPFATHLPAKRNCIYAQIGLCNPCPSGIEKVEDEKLKAVLRRKYLGNIKNVKMLLGGRVKYVKKILEDEMKVFVKEEKFEEAQELSLQIKALRNIAGKEEVGEYLENPNFLFDIRKKETDSLKDSLSKYFPLTKLSRIECFDIAHNAGLMPTASMVTFINGEAEKKYYRHFTMHNRKRISDVDSMREVLARRLKHLEDWGRPDLIIVDGGKPQVSAADEILKNTNIPFAGLAKRFETIVVKTNDGFEEVRAKGEALKLLQRIRDEAHRFARRLHHRQIKKALF